MSTWFATLLLAALALTPGDDRLDLTGRVVNAGGAPVKHAHVMIDTASVRKGTSPFCPSCYPDCRKRAETGPDGAFRLEGLDPELLFNVLVVADGYRPRFAERSDPKKGPVKVVLEAFDPSTLEPKRVLRGVVLDPDGKPLPGARVTAQGFATDAFRGFSPDIFDPVAVTNLAGEFVLTSKSPIEYADLRVEGSGVASQIFPARKPEANPHTIKMSVGATVTGRIVRGGKPVARAAVGLVQADRGAGTFLGETTIGTDADGRFTFMNVHPNDSYYVYGHMGSTGDEATPAKRIQVGDHGATTNVGDVATAPGHRIQGRVILSDGGRIPEKTRVLFSRENAWDTLRVELDREGRFEARGLPTERYSFSVSIRGYKLSPKNHSYQPNNPWSLAGTVDQDINGLQILLEPGDQ